MQSIQWENMFHTRVPLLDTQNKHLVEMLNVFFELQNEQPESDVLFEMLWRISKHFNEHFKQEELLYEQYVPEDLEEHRYQHSLFQDNLTSYCVSVLERETEPSHILCEYIRDWLVFHISHMDMNTASKIQCHIRT